MPTIAEQAGIHDEPEQELVLGNREYQEQAEEPRQGFSFNPFNGLLDIFKKPTGDQSLDYYQDHLFNFWGDKHGQRFARGASGLLGNLNSAVAEMVAGWMGHTHEKRKGAVKHDSNHSEPSNFSTMDTGN